MRKRLGAFSMAAMLVLALAAPVAASSGTAQCGGGANGYTNTSSSAFATHKFGSHSTMVDGPTTVNHGWFTGAQSWLAPTPVAVIV